MRGLQCYRLRVNARRGNRIGLLKMQMYFAVERHEHGARLYNRLVDDSGAAVARLVASE